MDNLYEIRPVHIWLFLIGPALGAYLGSSRFGLNQKSSSLYPGRNPLLMIKAFSLIALFALTSCLFEPGTASLLLTSIQGPVQVLFLQQFLSRPMEGALIGAILHYLLFQIFITMDWFFGFSSFWWYLLIFLFFLAGLIPLLIHPLNSNAQKQKIARPWIQKAILIWVGLTGLFSLQSSRRPLQILTTEVYQWEGAKAALFISFTQSQPEQVFPFRSPILNKGFAHTLEDQMTCIPQKDIWAWKPVVQDNILLAQFLKCDPQGEFKLHSSAVELASEIFPPDSKVRLSRAPKRVYFDSKTGALEYEFGFQSTLIFPDGKRQKGSRYQLNTFQLMQLEPPNGKLLQCPETFPDSFSTDWDLSTSCPRIHESPDQVAYLDRQFKDYSRITFFRIGIVNLKNPSASQEWEVPVPEGFHLNHFYTHEDRFYISLRGPKWERILNIYSLNQSHHPIELRLAGNHFQYRLHPSEELTSVQSPVFSALEMDLQYPLFHQEGIQVPLSSPASRSHKNTTELEIFLPYHSKTPLIHSFQVPANHSYHGILAPRRAVLLEDHLSSRIRPRLQWEYRDLQSQEVSR